MIWPKFVFCKITYIFILITFNYLLINSKYTLCPSGSGPNSIRFWEALGAGSIPILLADTLELPEHELWNNAILRIPEKNVSKLSEILNSISASQENIMRENCIKLYNYFKDNYINKDDLYNLEKWEEYEKSNPRIFAGMYQFWCKKI